MYFEIEKCELEWRKDDNVGGSAKGEGVINVC